MFMLIFIDDDFSQYPNWTNKNSFHFFPLPINEKSKKAATDKKKQFSATLSLIMNIQTQKSMRTARKSYLKKYK